MQSNETEKQYNELKKKFRLPEFRDINNEFELSDLEETSFLLRNIIRRIAEKLDFYTTVVEGVLQPDASSLHTIHETRFFDQDEKNKMYDTYRKLMNFNRMSIEISLEPNEKDEAQLICDFFDKWKEIKHELLRYAKKMKDSWKTETDIKEDLGYLG